MIRNSVMAMVAAVVLAGGLMSAQESKPKQQTTCPVMGGKVNKEIHADYRGRRVYFCCKGCVGQFKKDPEKYLKKTKEEGVAPEKVGKPQVMCPVMGRKIKKDFYTDYEGKRVYFCCPGCIPTFKKNPQKYMKKLQEEGTWLECTPGCQGGKGHHHRGGKGDSRKRKGCCG